MNDDTTGVTFYELRRVILRLVKSVRDNGAAESSEILFSLLEKLNDLWLDRQVLARGLADVTDELADLREEYADFAINENEHAIDQLARQVAADELVETLRASTDPVVQQALDFYENKIQEIEAV